MAETVDGLIRRVETATEIDERLAADIATLFFNEPFYPTIYGLAKLLLDPVSAVGAALKLADMALPGVFWLVGRGKTRAGEPPFGCQLLFGTDEIIGEGEHSAAPALAILLALLRALRSES